MVKLVAYYRVSTQKQGASGLGLEGQTAAVAAFARGQGAAIVREFTEVESGKRADRPELAKALTHAKRTGAHLVIAKLDRLGRNVAFLSNLMEAGVDFVACDNPHANRLTIHILAAVAEAEARMISERTKAALAAYKARGGKLGASRPECRNLTPADRTAGAILGGQATRAKAVKDDAHLVPEMREMRAAGLPLRSIARHLNDEGHTTRTGAPWSAVQVMRALNRADPACPAREPERIPAAAPPALTSVPSRADRSGPKSLRPRG